MFEWNEAAIGWDRGVPGGSFTSYGNHLSAMIRHSDYPLNESQYTGFRVARVTVLDADGDSDVDLDDFALFQLMFTGAR